MPSRILAVAALLLTPAMAQAPEDETPRRTELVERTGRRLAQLDVTVTGPPEQVADLGREDFELVVGGKYYHEFIVDRVCQDPEPGDEARVLRLEEGREPPPELPRPPGPTYLFYFDQVHLTMAGRHRAMQMAREFIPELVRDGARGMLLSSADALKVYVELTADAGRLVEGVDRLEDDREQWDLFAQVEDSRIAEVQRIRRISNTSAAIAAARTQQREEARRAARAQRRLSLVLGRLADVDPPKVVVYFADTMRRNAGEHYLSFLPVSVLNEHVEIAVAQDSGGGVLTFDKLIEQAAAHGVRIYTVQAEGLRTSFQPGLLTRERRFRDAEETLRGLAAETGGRAFVGGYRYKDVVASIRRDLSCVYLISFDPGGLAEDAALPVRLEVKRPGVRAHVRGRIVVQSESSRLTSTLLAAFGAPSALGDQAPIRGSLLPIGFERGRYRALLQVRVPGVSLSPTVWDLGATLVSDDRIALEESSRVEVRSPGVPVVLEAEADVRPGPWSVVAVAHEHTSDQTASRELKGNWPDPREQPVSVQALTVVQQGAAVFTREGELRSSGALVVPGDELLRTERATAFIGLVCWDGHQRRALRVERSLSGDDAAPFEPLTIEPGNDRCASLRDVVPPGTMTPGMFDYRVEVFVGDERVASASLRFGADGPAARGPSAGPEGAAGTSARP